MWGWREPLRSYNSKRRINQRMYIKQTEYLVEK